MRRRVRVGFVFGALVFWLAEPTPGSLALGGSVASVGEALRVWAAGHLRKSREVTSSGPYRWLAHPLYVGSSVMGIGLAIASASVVAGLLIAAYVGATITAAVRTEEALLRERFGAEYDRYRSNGQSAGWRSARGDRRRFSLGQAIANREHRTIAGLALAALLLLSKATYNGLFWWGVAGS